MLIEKNLGWLFHIQKYIFLPNHQVSQLRRRLVVLSIRILPLICLNIYALYNIFHLITADYLSYFGDKSTVSSIMSRFDMISIKFGVIFITLLSILKNKQHLHLLRRYQVFEKKFIEIFEKPTMRLIGVPGNFQMILICVYNFISNTTFHIFFIGIDSLAFIGYTFHMCNIFLDDISIFYILSIIHILSNFMTVFEEATSIPHNVEVFNILADYLDIIELINSTFGATIAYIFIHHFFEAWCSLYFALWVVFWHQWNHTSLTILISFIIWAVRSIFVVILTAFVCQRCSEKMKGVTKSLGKIYEDYCCREHMDFQEKCIQFNAQQFLFLHQHRETKISAGELFTINVLLVSAIFSTIASYLVILLQFKQLEEFLEAQSESEIA